MDALLTLIVLVFICFGIWKVISAKNLPQSKDLPSTKSKGSPESILHVRRQEFHWEGNGDFEFEVVGESNYQSLLADLAGEHGTKSAEAQHKATLVLEDTNPYDTKAVAVRIDGKLVGYLSREDARSYRRRLGQKGISGVNATCNAIVIGGGTRKNGERLFYGVKLDIKPFK